MVSFPYFLTFSIKGETRRGGDDFTGAKTVWASEAGVFVAANLEGSFPGHVPAASRSDHARCRGAEQGSPFADKLGDDARGTINFDRLDAYVRRYNFNGDVIWTHQFGSGVFDIVAALATDATSVYASWRYELRDRPGSDVLRRLRTHLPSP